MTVTGIDVSKHNGNVDFTKVKQSGIKFVILRAGYGKYTKQIDTQFKNNYLKCKAVGLPVGAYWYSYATTPEEAMQEGMACLEILKGKCFEYPIYYDIEEKATLNSGTTNVCNIIKAFCSTLESYGYFVGVYMSRSPYDDLTTTAINQKYTTWIAEYNSKCNTNKVHDMWQKTCTYKITGCSGYFDLDYCYKDFPKIIKANHKNGF